MKFPLSALAVAAMTLMAASDVQAQLFGGTRQLGTHIQRPAGAGNNAEVGAIRGNERFVRGNRKRTDFVGTDTREQRDFIGTVGSVSGQVRSATEGLQVESSEDANERLRAATQQRDVMYDPRLQVDFDFNPLSPEAMRHKLEHRLSASPHLDQSAPVSLTVKEETVTIRGQVASEHERTLIELLLLLEPGVDHVRNNLTVKPAPPRSNSPRPTDAGS